jgi:hypothetical protein
MASGFPEEQCCAGQKDDQHEENQQDKPAAHRSGMLWFGRGRKLIDPHVMPPLLLARRYS